MIGLISTYLVVAIQFHQSEEDVPGNLTSLFLEIQQAAGM